MQRFRVMNKKTSKVFLVLEKFWDGFLAAELPENKMKVIGRRSLARKYQFLNVEPQQPTIAIAPAPQPEQGGEDEPLSPHTFACSECGEEFSDYKKLKKHYGAKHFDKLEI